MTNLNLKQPLPTLPIELIDNVILKYLKNDDKWPLKYRLLSKKYDELISPTSKKLELIKKITHHPYYVQNVSFFYGFGKYYLNQDNEIIQRPAIYFATPNQVVIKTTQGEKIKLRISNEGELFKVCKNVYDDEKVYSEFRIPKDDVDSFLDKHLMFDPIKNLSLAKKTLTWLQGFAKDFRLTSLIAHYAWSLVKLSDNFVKWVPDILVIKLLALSLFTCVGLSAFAASITTFFLELAIKTIVCVPALIFSGCARGIELIKASTKDWFKKPKIKERQPLVDSVKNKMYATFAQNEKFDNQHSLGAIHSNPFNMSKTFIKILIKGTTFNPGSLKRKRNESDNTFVRSYKMKF